jgi:hypothetical protein
MKMVVYVFIWMLGLGQALAQDACSSLSALSDDPILRALQNTLGWEEESSLYRLCVREQNRSVFYRESDSRYFNSDLSSDQAYRDGLKAGSTESEVVSGALPQTSYEEMREKEKDQAASLNKLRSQNYQSIGVFGDQ